MVDHSPARSRGLLKPVLGGLALIAALVAAIYFRVELWTAIKWLVRTFGNWLTEWVPDHPGQSSAIIGFAVRAFVINWLAHVRGRLRAWIFAIVVEIGLWLLFWYGAGIPSLNELLGLDIEKMTLRLVLSSGIIVIAVTGVLFWFLELREEWKKYRHRTDTD
jgi:hypothetical protein